VKAEDYEQAQAQVTTLAQLVRLIPLEDMKAQQDRTDAVAPMLDPTLYRQALDDPKAGWETVKRLTTAAVEFQREVNKILEPLDGGPPLIVDPEA